MYIPSFSTYLSVYILTKREFISSCRRPAVGSNIVQITRATFCVNVLKKMAAGSHFGCPKITSYHFRSIPQFLFLWNKMAAGGHFGCPKFTFDRISGHFRSNENKIWNFLQNGRQRTFLMFENHFWLHFWQFQIDRLFWMSEIYFR